MIDADQTFPDTWQGINQPAWLGSEACDFVLETSGSLTKGIKALDVHEMLELLKKNGIRFQEKPEELVHPDTNENLIVGGEAFNILNAFHIVAKIGLSN